MESDGKSITYLRNTPRNQEGSLLGVGKHATGGVVEAEVGGTVDDDTLDGYTESSVETFDTVGLCDLAQAVTKTGELTLTTSFADIGGQPVQTLDKLILFHSCAREAKITSLL